MCEKINIRKRVVREYQCDVQFTFTLHNVAKRLTNSTGRDEMERRLEKQQLCWNANMSVGSDCMEWKYEGQGADWSVVERQKRDHDTESSRVYSKESI